MPKMVGGHRAIARQIIAAAPQEQWLRAHRLEAALITISLGRSKHWVKVKNPKVLAVAREAEQDWGR
jgi:hypothetical protein